MKWLRQLCLLLIFVNAGAWLWGRFQTDEIIYKKKLTESGIPSLILQQEYLQLQKNAERTNDAPCWRIGPFANEQEMRAAWHNLEYIAKDMQKRQAQFVDSQIYTLTVPASSSREDAELILESLQTAGIQGAQILEQSRKQYAITIGNYATLDAAQAQQHRAQQLGIEVVLSSAQKQSARWWIEASVRNQTGFMQWQAEQTPKIPVIDCQ
jgi:hypothetical protein